MVCFNNEDENKYIAMADETVSTIKDQHPDAPEQALGMAIAVRVGAQIMEDMEEKIVTLQDRLDEDPDQLADELHAIFLHGISQWVGICKKYTFLPPQFLTLTILKHQPAAFELFLLRGFPPQPEI